MAQSAAGDIPGRDLAADRAALLELHERQREAHFARDAHAFQALLADEMVVVQGGQVLRVGRAQNLARVKRYFAAVEFLEWDDIAPPVITISGDGTLATVAVHKRVTVRAAGSAASASGPGPGLVDEASAPSTTIFAWTSTCEKRDGRWLVTQIASTRDPDPAKTLLAAAVQALGSPEAREAIRSMRTLSDGQSPRGPYSMTIESVRGDGLRFVQSSERGTFEAWIRGDKGRTYRDGKAVDLDAKTMSMLRGHEFQLIAMTLDKRFSDWKLAGTRTFAGRVCDVLRARDDLGLPAEIFLGREDHRLAGMVITDPRIEGQTVRMTFDRWTDVAGVTLPNRVTALDHQGTFVLDFRDISVNGVDPSSWPSL